MGPVPARLLLLVHAAFAALTRGKHMKKSLLIVLLGALAAGRGMAKDCDHCEDSDGACNEGAILAADQALQQDVAAHGIVSGFNAALTDDGQLIATGEATI